MSRYEMDQISCEHCHHVHDYVNYRVVNIAIEPQLKDAIMDDSIFTFTCPDCGFTKNYHHPLFYYDPEQQFIIEYSADFERFKHFISLFHQHNIFDKYTIRWTDNWYTFKETIQIIDHQRDDRVIAMYKKLLLDDFRVRNPECGTAMALYDVTDEERLVIISENLEPRLYSFPNKWYDSVINKPITQKVLKYGNTLILDDDYVRDITNMDVTVKIADVKLPLEQKNYILSIYDDGFIGDHVLVDTLHSIKPIEGIIENIFDDNIRDLPFGIKTIKHIVYNDEERDTFSPFFADIHAHITQNDVYTLLDILMDTVIYIPMHYKNKKISTMAIEIHTHQQLIPLYTSKDFCQNQENVLYFRETFDNIIHQDIITADGFVINPQMPEFLVVDESFIHLYDNYKLTHQYSYS
ncbi:MAG: CpXC domain-containing protein [Erysipelotrichaceae bacterium]|nr:CpXC domain-containing protein [Erysipelotrichaceae bacterium]